MGTPLGRPGGGIGRGGYESSIPVFRLSRVGNLKEKVPATKPIPLKIKSKIAARPLFLGMQLSTTYSFSHFSIFKTLLKISFKNSRDCLKIHIYICRKICENFAVQESAGEPDRASMLKRPASAHRISPASSHGACRLSLLSQSRSFYIRRTASPRTGNHWPR